MGNLLTGGTPQSLSDPSLDAALVTASDGTADPAGPFRALYIGVAQTTLKVTTYGGSVVTFSAVPVGFVLPVAVSRVWSTGTTDATKIVGLK